MFLPIWTDLIPKSTSLLFGSRNGTVESTFLPPMWLRILRLNAIYGLSLLLVMISAPRGFSPGTLLFPSPQKPTFPNSNLIQISVDK